MKRLMCVVLSLLTVLGAGLFVMGQAGASSFNRSRIIDDAVFDKSNSMTATQIDNWINSKYGSTSCISTTHGFSAPAPSGYSPSKGFTYSGRVSAGHVISDAAQAYGINPRVLLTTLQKEQSLVSGSGGCSTLAYTGAMGYGCPDGGTTHNYSGVNLYTINGHTVTSVHGTCVNSSSKAGFSQQVIRGAWLLKFGEERSEGKVSWAVVKGSWDNSDDPDSCYGGPMTQGTFSRGPSGCGATTFYDGYTTIDGVSTHMDTGATATLYWYTPHFAGNQNFYNIYTGWFGSTYATPFFRVSGSSAIYVLGADSNYYWVPSNTVLGAYGYGERFKGIDSFASSYISGLTYSGALPLITKFDGGTSIYLADGGGTHHFTSQPQLNNFGFVVGDSADLPGWIYDGMVHSTDMQYVVKQSRSPAIYYVQNDKESHIINWTAFTTLGSPAYSTQSSVTLTGAFVESLPVGGPIMPAGSFVKNSTTGGYDIWNGTNLQPFSTPIAQSVGLPLDYSAPTSELSQLTTSGTTVGKLAKSSGGTLYILDYQKKLTVTSGQLANLGIGSGSFVTTDDTFLAKFSGGSMQSLFKVNNGSYVYSIISGTLYHVFSGQDFGNLGYSWANVANVDSTTGNLFTNNHNEIFAQGRLVRIDSTPTIYLIDGSFAKKTIPSMNIFNNYGYNMHNVVSTSSTGLGAYSTSGNLAQVVKDSSVAYWLVDSGHKRLISGTMLGASYYNINTAGVLALSDQNMASISTTSALTEQIKATDSDKVYKVVNGQKRWFTTPAAFAANGGDWSKVIMLSPSYVDSIPSGANY